VNSRGTFLKRRKKSISCILGGAAVQGSGGGKEKKMGRNKSVRGKKRKGSALSPKIWISLIG